MKRYVKGVLGGILAILAAFGWTVALAAVIVWKDESFGIHISKGITPWVTLFLIFSTGFYLGFRKIY